jgi:D-alanyl-D-alanine carboxypeptidase
VVILIVLTVLLMLASTPVGDASPSPDASPPPDASPSADASPSPDASPSADARPSPAPAVTETPAPEAGESPAPRLPACRYGDESTRYDRVREWHKTLLDTNLRLPRSYEPWDLVSVSRAGIRGSGLVRRLVIADLGALAAAARKAGNPLAVRSAYRSYRTQRATFASWVERSGYEEALKFSARAGHSEHQLGTTIDFTTAPGEPLSSTFGDTPAGRWLAANGWRFGFVMSYPKGARRVSCYGYEPWHFRYVGREGARLIHESGQVPRRYLWEHLESAP